MQVLQVSEREVQMLESGVANVQINPARAILSAVDHAAQGILDVGHIAADHRIGIVGETLGAIGGHVLNDWPRFGAYISVDIEAGWWFVCVSFGVG